jgi:Ser/Thr protein kinase RdoA (MazF antagonist)
VLPEMPATVRAKVTDPDAAAAAADRFLDHIAGMESSQPFDLMSVGLLEQRKILLDEYGSHRPGDEMPKGPLGWTHGDVQHRNILWLDGKVAVVLDWDRIGVRPYAEEVARTAQVQFGGEDGRLDLERVAAFVAGYRTVIDLAERDLADAVERLWWKRMTDYWVLEFHYDRHDHSCDDLWGAGELLLDWWTSHRDDVQGAFAARS